MSHADHPGHGATCRARLTINAAPNGTSYSGYSCKVTGGHCIPCDRCTEWLKVFDTHLAQNVKLGIPCNHWFHVKKHHSGPATKVCQDCGYEEAV